jgi:hypothetical protein
MKDQSLTSIVPASASCHFLSLPVSCGHQLFFTTFLCYSWWASSKSQ